ncbi:MAG: Ig-like domain-containing protein [Oscillospiraceae bacterium]|nr:Ig-like domain-containing protein [Oscillospiraceae bacterium]
MSIPVKGVTIPKTIRTVNIGDIFVLEAAVLPCNAANRSVVWAIKAGSDLVRFENGDRVRAVAAGTVIIRAISVQNCAIGAECAVTIEAVKEAGSET